jgi:hypothetical protein
LARRRCCVWWWWCGGESERPVAEVPRSYQPPKKIRRARVRPDAARARPPDRTATSACAQVASKPKSRQAPGNWRRIDRSSRIWPISIDAGSPIFASVRPLRIPHPGSMHACLPPSASRLSPNARSLCHDMDALLNLNLNLTHGRVISPCIPPNHSLPRRPAIRASLNL